MSDPEGTSYYEPAMAAHVADLEAVIFRLERDGLDLRRALDDERNVMPSEGVFLVEHNEGGKAYMRIAKLGEFPEPMRFASVARHLDAIAAAIAEARAAAQEGWFPSPRTEAEAVIRALAKAEGGS